jgi:hypothetical protein
MFTQAQISAAVGSIEKAYTDDLAKKLNAPARAATQLCSHLHPFMARWMIEQFNAGSEPAEVIGLLGDAIFKSFVATVRGAFPIDMPNDEFCMIVVTLFDQMRDHVAEFAPSMFPTMKIEETDA